MTIEQARKGMQSGDIVSYTIYRGEVIAKKRSLVRKVIYKIARRFKLVA